MSVREKGDHSARLLWRLSLRALLSSVVGKQFPGNGSLAKSSTARTIFATSTGAIRRRSFLVDLRHSIRQGAIFPQFPDKLIVGDRLLLAAIRNSGKIVDILQKLLVISHRQNHRRLVTGFVCQVLECSTHGAKLHPNAAWVEAVRVCSTIRCALPGCEGLSDPPPLRGFASLRESFCPPQQKRAPFRLLHEKASE